MPKPLLAAALLVAATLTAGAAPQSPPATARIKIDPDRTIGQVDPLVFGNFAEHLGRMIYGGLYEEGSPLSDANGYRRDVMDAVHQLGVTILRWPGGNFSSGYNWMDGIGPKDARPVRKDLAWDALESNRFGTDEFLRYCELMHIEPYVTVNLGLGTIDEARYWVEYTNEAKHTYWADQRRKNGHDAPYGVKYWALGNEIDGPWQLGHKSADEYARFALEAGKAMRAVDPTIKLVASGSSNYGADWIGWNRTVLETLRNTVDYIALHTYIGDRDNDLERFLGASQQNLERYIETTAALIREVRTGPNPRPISIAYDEWNVWYRTGSRELLEEVYNFEDALAMGMFFNTFIRHADVVKMANLAQMVNVIAPIMTNEQGLYLQTIFFPIAEYGKQRGNTSLDAWVSSPTYTLPNRPQQPIAYLDVSSTIDSAGRTLYVNVLNRSKARDLTAAIEIQDKPIAPAAEVWQMDNADLKAVNTFGDDHKVRPTTRNVSIDTHDGAFEFPFPAHSLTILRLQIR
ncbi:MAG TPA: alpha-L-arabinofuranosidase C-terminal domain-containing protein [Vicinamibacterales bacterium]|nr:alpha-L-arabinofuranosidase C-terminal domain-containing protein [Vicinamibacterales bacterium]